MLTATETPALWIVIAPLWPAAGLGAPAGRCFDQSIDCIHPVEACHALTTLSQAARQAAQWTIMLSSCSLQHTHKALQVCRQWHTSVLQQVAAVLAVAVVWLRPRRLAHDMFHFVDDSVGCVPCQVLDEINEADRHRNARALG